MKRGFDIGKRGQIMGMPFQMIFSLLLIAVFIVVVFFVIMHFLSIQNCSQIGLFQRDLQDKINSVWNADLADAVFTGTLPSSIKYACFLNFTRGKILTGLNAEQREIAGSIYSELEGYYKYRKANFFIYPTKAACDMPFKLLAHVDDSNIPNPYCIANKGEVSIKLYKGFDDSSVKIKQ